MGAARNERPKERKIFNPRLLVGIFLIALILFIFPKSPGPQPLTTSESDTQVYYTRGNDYYGEKDYDNAISDYTEAIRLKPDYADAYNDRGYAYESQGKLAKAMLDLVKANPAGLIKTCGACSKGESFPARPCRPSRRFTPRPGRCFITQAQTN